LFYTHSTVSPYTNDNTTHFTKKEIRLQFWQQPEKNIDDNLQPAIDLLHSWGLELLLEHKLV
jgi:hypothetical protein